MPDPSDTPLVPEILPANDHLLTKFRYLTGKLVGYYEFIAYRPTEEVEKELQENPLAWEARLKIAPVVFSRILPVRQSIQHESAPKKRLSAGELAKMGFSVEQLKRLAQSEDNNETDATLVELGSNGNVP
jgi:hypothetical protein